MEQVRQKIAEAWKAVVAVLIPLVYAAAIEVVGALDEWAASEGGAMWAVVLGAALTGAGVWLKRNRPA